LVGGSRFQTRGLGGSGGGGNGEDSSNSDTAGAANTGGGGGGGNSGAAGGSGVVIFKVPRQAQVTFSAGVTSTLTPVGPFDVYTVTATSTTDETVTIG
jgi:hypothetical protein